MSSTIGKRILCIFFVLITLFLFTVSSFALSATSYGDLPSTSSQAINLLNYAMSFDDFMYSDYVCFRDSQYSYYLVWSADITWSGSTISADDIKYVRYFRNSNYDEWQYGYGTDTSFTFSTAYLVTSNIQGLGSTSAVYETYKTQSNLIGLIVAIGSFAFALMLIKMKGGQNG